MSDPPTVAKNSVKKLGLNQSAYTGMSVINLAPPGQWTLIQPLPSTSKSSPISFPAFSTINSILFRFYCLNDGRHCQIGWICISECKAKSPP